MSFTRPTLIAAVELFERHTQASFNQAMLRLGLQNSVPSTDNVSVAKKCFHFGHHVIQNTESQVDTLEGRMTLGEAVVREAVRLMQPRYDDPLQQNFARGLSRDGFVLTGDLARPIRAALPSEIQLPEADDEVHKLLRHFGFLTPLGHLDQAIDAHTRGDWAACNSQLRTFLEGLLDDISVKIDPTAASLASSANKRDRLGQLGFLVPSWGEWSSDGKNYVNGLFKMLHTQGSHPGLSDEDHSTFRLHLVLVTGRTLLRRIPV